MSLCCGCVGWMEKYWAMINERPVCAMDFAALAGAVTYQLFQTGWIPAGMGGNAPRSTLLSPGP